MFIFRQRKLFKLKAWQKSLQSLKEEVHEKHWFHHHLLRQHGIFPCHLQRNQDKHQQNPYQSTFIGKKSTKLKIFFCLWRLFSTLKSTVTFWQKVDFLISNTS